MRLSGVYLSVTDEIYCYLWGIITIFFKHLHKLFYELIYQLFMFCRRKCFDKIASKINY